jgi:hypothetical protein
VNHKRQWHANLKFLSLWCISSGADAFISISLNAFKNQHDPLAAANQR